MHRWWMVAALATVAGHAQALQLGTREGVEQTRFYYSVTRAVPGSTPVAVSVTGGRNSQYSIDQGRFTNDPGVVRGGQTVTVRHISAPAPQTLTRTTLRLGGNDSVFSTITGGVPPLSLAVLAPAALDEGADDTARAIFDVTLNRAADEAVTVDYATVAGTAAEGDDFQPVSGTLAFTAGETRKTVEVPIVGDVCHEDDETLGLALSNPQGAALFQAVATTELINDDPLGPPLRAGAAKRVVSPTAQDIAGHPHEYCPDLTQQFYLGGFGLRRVDASPCESPLALEGKDPVDGVTADAHIRVMLVEQDGGPMVAFAMLDAVGAGNVIQLGVKRAISDAIGIPQDNIQFGATHAHSGADLQGLWGGVPFEWRQNLYAQAADAAVEARDALQAAELRTAKGVVDDPSYNNYRREDDSIGTDMLMSVLQARSLGDDPQVIGTVVQYAAHPTQMGSGSTEVHGDYITGINNRIEALHPGSTALYFNGPIADAAPRANTPDGLSREERAETMGAALADLALAMLADDARVFHPELNYRTAEATVPVTNHLFQAIGAKGYFNGYYDFVNPMPDPDARATPAPQAVSSAFTVVSRLTVGRIGCNAIEVVTLPGEASNLIGQSIRALAPRDMMLLGLTHNSFGYILDESQYGGENGTTLATDPDPVYPAGYEEGVSLGPGTAAALREQGWHPLFDVLPGS